jgi:hypothetical protein
MDFLRSKLDFNIRRDFEKELLISTGFGTHDSVGNDKGFHLLATFRRYLFHLNEDSVALALHSCLGGLPQHFHVSYQSHNNFKFTVSCKAVGFAIYKLRRFIGSSIDVYFHLWSNGAPHWEREKRLWEVEEAKKWSKVISIAQKRLANRSAKTSQPRFKHVRFAEKIMEDSPINKSRPPEVKQTIKIGDFVLSLPSEPA